MSTLPELRSVRLAGVDIHALDQQRVIDYLIGSLAAGRGGWLVNPNIDVLRQIERDPQVRDLVARATLVVSYGAPVEWAARLAGTPLPPRVPGSSLIWALSAAAAAHGRGIFLLGGAPGIAERAGQALAAAAPGLTVAGSHCPPLGFEHDAGQQEAIRQALTAANPDIVFCGLGFPKQERLMDALAGAFPRTWFIGSGASLTFAAGEVARAPRWMQRVGIEWVFRLVSEPRRLARRYLVDDLPYAVRLLSRSVVQRRARRGAGA